MVWGAGGYTQWKEDGDIESDYKVGTSHSNLFISIFQPDDCQRYQSRIRYSLTVRALLVILNELTHRLNIHQNIALKGVKMAKNSKRSIQYTVIDYFSAKYMLKTKKLLSYLKNEFITCPK